MLGEGHFFKPRADVELGDVPAARSALNSLQGAFSARVNHLVEALTKERWKR